MSWLAGDVKISTRLSYRVGHQVPGVVVRPLVFTEGWGGKCSEILATIKLLYNPRVNKEFTSHSVHFTFNTVFCRIIAGDNFYFRTKRGRLFEGGDYFKYFSQEIVP